MSNPATTFSAQDALSIINVLGQATSAIDPKLGAGVAALTGIAELINTTLVPFIQQFHAQELSIAQQAGLAAQSAAERAAVGAPAATIN